MHGALHAQRAPPSHREWTSAALKAIFAMELREAALAKAEAVATEMESRKLKAAANCLRGGASGRPRPICCPSSPPSTAGGPAPTT